MFEHIHWGILEWCNPFGDHLADSASKANFDNVFDVTLNKVLGKN